MAATTMKRPRTVEEMLAAEQAAMTPKLTQGPAPAGMGGTELQGYQGSRSRGTGAPVAPGDFSPQGYQGSPRLATDAVATSPITQIKPNVMLPGGVTANPDALRNLKPPATDPYSGRANLREPGGLISDPSQMGPPEPAASPAPTGGFSGMGDVRMAERNAAPVAATPSAIPQDDAHMTQMRMKSAQLLRDMYRPGVTPAMHAEMAKQRADIEDNLHYYRNGLATRTAPAPLSPEQIAASKASLDSQAAGGDGSFQGPIQGADQGMVDKVNAARDSRFQSGEKYRAAGLNAARTFGDEFATREADAKAYQDAQAKADIAQQQARGAVAASVVKSGGLTPDQQLAEAKAQSEIAHLNRENAAIAGTGGTTPELAAATQQQKQAAFDKYGVNGGWQKNVDDALGVLRGTMSDLHSGEVAGNFWGGAEDANRAADLVDSQLGALERMRATDPAAASEIATSILNSPNFPAADANGNYLDSKAGGGAILSPGTGFLPENQRNRRAVVSKLTSIRRRLQSISGAQR